MRQCRRRGSRRRGRRHHMRRWWRARGQRGKHWRRRWRRGSHACRWYDGLVLVVQGRRFRRCRGRGCVPEGEGQLVEHDVSRGEHAACHRVEAAVPAVIRRIAKEDTGDGARTEFVRRGGAQVGETQRPKDAKHGVVWWHAEQQFMRRAVCAGTTWAPVDEERRRRERLGPKLWRSCTMY